jgi:hypothetical protein
MPSLPYRSRHIYRDARIPEVDDVHCEVRVLESWRHKLVKDWNPFLARHRARKNHNRDLQLDARLCIHISVARRKRCGHPRRDERGRDALLPGVLTPFVVVTSTGQAGGLDTAHLRSARPMKPTYKQSRVACSSASRDTMSGAARVQRACD